MKILALLDQILRGDLTTPDRLAAGKLEIPYGRLLLLLVLLGMTSGFFIGWHSIANRADPQWIQIVGSMCKVPLLFLLTLLVTFPSLYVFSLLIGSRLSAGSTLRLISTALAVNLAVLASIGPIVGFFSISTSSYPFMVLLNVLFFTVAGLLGVSFLLRTLYRLHYFQVRSPLAMEAALKEKEQQENESDVPVRIPGPLDPTEKDRDVQYLLKVVRCWIFVFAIVGAQMGWVLRPFIGNPDQPFEWFRPRQSNFFEAVWKTFESLLR